MDLIQIHARAITGAHFERRLLSRDPLQGIKGSGKGRRQEQNLALYRSAVALKPTKDKLLFITELKGDYEAGVALGKIKSVRNLESRVYNPPWKYPSLFLIRSITG